MKKAFTMIELIFVIVILGILAAVAIPKLNATRDDAEISKALSNFSTLITDLSSYYTTKGNFAEGIGNMTNVSLNQVGNNPLSTYVAAYLGVGKVTDCLYIEADGRPGKKVNYIMIRSQAKKDLICQDLIDKINTLNLVGSAYSDINLTTPTSTIDKNSTSNKVYIKVGGNNVAW